MSSWTEYCSIAFMVVMHAKFGPPAQTATGTAIAVERSVAKVTKIGEPQRDEQPGRAAHGHGCLAVPGGQRRPKKAPRPVQTVNSMNPGSPLPCTSRANTGNGDG
ncbi:MAG: hypothetical protein U5K56_20945 [Halioglobus sp.]|nr:hypothetical protein [Halioglobus sp.]